VAATRKMKPTSAVAATATPSTAPKNDGFSSDAIVTSDLPPAMVHSIREFHPDCAVGLLSELVGDQIAQRTVETDTIAVPRLA